MTDSRPFGGEFPAALTEPVLWVRPDPPTVEDIAATRCPDCVSVLVRDEVAGAHGLIAWLVVHADGCPALRRRQQAARLERRKRRAATKPKRRKGKRGQR